MVHQAKRIRESHHAELFEAKRAELVNARRASIALMSENGATEKEKKKKAAKGPYDVEEDVDAVADGEDPDAIMDFTDEDIERMLAEDEEAMEREAREHERGFVFILYSLLPNVRCSSFVVGAQLIVAMSI